MPTRTPCLVLLAVAVTWAAAGGAPAFINPQLQPSHLFDRYVAVIGGEVVHVDYDARTLRVRVREVLKGPFAAQEVTVQGAGEEIDDGLNLLSKGMTFVGFVGRQPRRGQTASAGQAVFYAGEGNWEVAEFERPDDPSRWRWARHLPAVPEPDETVSMFGTFNGHEDQLLALVRDVPVGRAYYPSHPYVRFLPDREIGRFAKPVRGVALYDIDGDGRLDVYACSEAGNRLYLQTNDRAFKDRTELLGLSGLATPSCNFADVDADGRPDLLAGAAVYLAGADGFARSALLPPRAAEALKTSAFVEINGDGRPDVVVSRAGGGLAVYLNPGPGGGGFRDATSGLGLDLPEAGAGGDGFFAPGDWNGDGRTDLFYAAGRGLLLLQAADGRFAPLKHGVLFDFDGGGEAGAGGTGAGAFGTLFHGDRQALIVPQKSDFVLVAELGGTPTDVAYLGNEVSEATYKQLLSLVEDLNADGYVDFYTTSWSEKQPAYFHMNRGYGSFMRPEKYDLGVFPGTDHAHRRGAWGAAAGDVDGDGANDLVLGGVDGRLAIALNATLGLRTPKEHPTFEERTQREFRILTVRVSGKVGVLGAAARLTAADGRRVVALRQIGSNVLTGCRGPDTLNLTVREPGRYVLAVRFSDGYTQTWPVDLTAPGRTVLDARRDGAPRQAVVAEAGGPK